MANIYSVDQSWVTLGATNVVTRCGSRGTTPCVQTDVTYVGIPKTASGFAPSGPKGVIAQALPNIASIQDILLARQIDILSNNWNHGTGDVAEVLSMPVFMISQALQAMGTVKSIGEQAKKDKMIALIVEILGIIFAFIPFLDEVGPALGIADGAFEIVSAAGNVALAIQGIISVPSSAPMENLSAVTLGKMKTTKDFADLAAAKRLVTADDLSSIGATFKSNEDKMEETLKHSCFLK